MKKHKRSNELQWLNRIATSNKSEFVYVRGRRRVGKSWLLSDFQKEDVKTRFLFSGAQDSDSLNTLVAFVNLWSTFSQDSKLSEIKRSLLDWPRVFGEIHRWVVTAQRPLTLIFDEIQWIAIESSGFVGALKAVWVEWQQAGLIKVIVCGSSNKFFREKTGSEESVLRGLNTRPHLWVQPFSPALVWRHCFPQWRCEEVALVYMMLGGIPYYLERLDGEKPFIHAINDGLFTAEQNLLDEVDALLSLDFNAAGRATAKKVLSVLGQDGCDQKNICLKTGLPANTVFKVVNKLLDYAIIFEKHAGHPEKKQAQRGLSFFMKDFFLNFYFQVLRQYSETIRANATRGLVFPQDVHLSQAGYTIPNFTGKAFELFCRYVFEQRQDVAGAAWAHKLNLRDVNYTVYDYRDRTTQIDLIVEHRDDRVTRLIECKWGQETPQWLDDVLGKRFEPPKNFVLQRVLTTMTEASARLQTRAKEQGVVLLSLKDFYPLSSDNNPTPNM